MFGGTPDTTEGLRSRVARGRPNWWVILAVSLGLMALLVATAGGAPHATHRAGGSAQAASRASGRSGTSAGQHTGSPSVSSTTTTAATATTSTSTTPSGPANVASSLRTSGIPSGATALVPSSPSVTPTTVAPVATTTTTSASSADVAADRTQSPGYLNPPQHADDQFGFTGTGAMVVSVVWSGDTYLSLQVNCPSGDQSAGGTSAMEAALPDASGSCIATVTEPASETTSLTFTISIGPSGG